MKLRSSIVIASAAVVLALAFQPTLRAAAAKEPVEIVRIWTAYREAKSFARLSEYFDGKENTGSEIILRSQPDQRDGFYFTVRLTSPDRTALPDGRVVLEVIAPDEEKARTYAFPFSADSKQTARLEIGVTGSDWKHGRILPLAWKLEILAPDGRKLASRESFLWSKPAAPAR